MYKQDNFLFKFILVKKQKKIIKKLLLKKLFKYIKNYQLVEY